MGTTRKRGAQQVGRVPGWIKPTTLILVILLVILLAYLVAQMLITLMTPLQSGDASLAPRSSAATSKIQTDYAALREYDLFGTTEIVTDDVVDDSNVAETKLNIKLVAVFADGAGGGTATFDIAPEGGQVFLPGEEINNNVTLKEVWWNRALISRGGIVEKVFMEDLRPGSSTSHYRNASPPASRPQGVPALEDDQELEAALKSAETYANTIEVLVNTIDLRPSPDGIALYPGRESKKFVRLGFAAGDIVTKVDGKAVSQMDQLFDRLSNLSPSQPVTVTIKRNGRELDKTLQLSDLR